MTNQSSLELQVRYMREFLQAVKDGNWTRAKERASRAWDTCAETAPARLAPAFLHVRRSSAHNAESFQKPVSYLIRSWKGFCKEIAKSYKHLRVAALCQEIQKSGGSDDYPIAELYALLDSVVEGESPIGSEVFKIANLHKQALLEARNSNSDAVLEVIERIDAFAYGVEVGCAGVTIKLGTDFSSLLVD